MALNFTLLTEDQIWYSTALEVIKEYGTEVAPTDLAALQGAEMSKIFRTSEGNLTCTSLTSSLRPDSFVRTISYDGTGGHQFPQKRRGSVRPVLPPTETKKIKPTAMEKGIDDIDIVEYGEYPQTAVDDQTSSTLEELFQKNLLQTTGKTYTYDSVHDDEAWEMDFKKISQPEYEHNGEKYIRIFGQMLDNDSRLSSEEKIKDNTAYWVRVEPIQWLVDPSGTWVSKKALFTGIQFDTKEEYNGDFKNTFIKQYLDTYFAKEIEPSELPSKKRGLEIEGLKARLAEASDLERARADTKPASTPERTEIAARMKRVRRERDVIRVAAAKARESGDEKLLEQIAEIAKPSMARAEVVMDKFYARREARRAARAKKARE